MTERPFLLLLLLLFLLSRVSFSVAQFFSHVVSFLSFFFFFSSLRRRDRFLLFTQPTVIFKRLCKKRKSESRYKVFEKKDIVQFLIP